MNKKILALLMALLMVLTSVAAFAEGDTTTEKVVVEETSFTLNKTYTGDGRDGETFEFELKNDADNKGPALTFADGTNTLTFAADNIASAADDGVPQSLTINVPAVGEDGYEAKPATYEYTLTEKTGTNNAITYDTTIWNVKVTVYNAAAEGEEPSYKTTLSIKKNGAKNDTADFVNTYAGASTLKVKKQIAGNMANMSDTFEITVSFKDAQGNALVLANAVAWNTLPEGVTVTRAENGIDYVIAGIGHDDEVTFTNLPQGTVYEVEETKAGDYTAKYDGKENGTIAESTDVATVVTNTKSTDIDTGVFTDNMPYFMLMAFVMILAAAVVLKKRTVNE